MAEEHLFTPTTSSVVVIEAQPTPLRIDPTQTAVLVIDMQNDFGAKSGMFDRAGIDSHPRFSVCPRIPGCHL